MLSWLQICPTKILNANNKAKSRHKLKLTARQYGEVVLPDPAPTEASGASTGQSPGTPRQRGQKAVTVQGGYGALFAVPVQSFVNITSVAVQV